jgi:hypothetical protein
MVSIVGLRISGIRTRTLTAVVVDPPAGSFVASKALPRDSTLLFLGIVAFRYHPSDPVGGKGDLIAQACGLRCQRFDFLITALQFSPEDHLCRSSGISLPLYGLQRLMRLLMGAIDSLIML